MFTKKARKRGTLSAGLSGLFKVFKTFHIGEPEKMRRGSLDPVRCIREVKNFTACRAGMLEGKKETTQIGMVWKGRLLSM